VQCSQMRGMVRIWGVGLSVGQINLWLRVEIGEELVQHSILGSGNGQFGEWRSRGGKEVV
jgi:hypothetical protein